METTPGVVPIVEDDQLYDWGIENSLTDYQYCQVGATVWPGIVSALRIRSGRLYV